MKKRVHERAFIESLRQGAGLKPAFLKLGLGDDAAVLRPGPGFDTLLTCDLLVESVHFDLKTTSPWELGAKCLAANLSDIAAMGGLPRAYTVSLAIPRRSGLKSAFFKALYAGMRAWAESFGAVLAGGDTSYSPGPLFIDIAMLGEVEKGRELRRSGARPGDYIFCTGHPGDSAAGLAVLQGRMGRKHPAAAALLSKRHLTPVPRVIAGRFLSTRRAASACIDISDGLASESHHISRESGVAIELDADALPLSAASLSLAPRAKALAWALTGGEDYELLFTARPSKLALLQREFSKATGCALSLIGRVRRGKGVRLRTQGGWKRLADAGYEHKIF